METLSIVAYLGPCSRPEIARIRGVAADSAVAGLLERGLIAEAGRDDGAGGAVRYRTTPLFERVFGLESAAALPRLDDLGETAAEIRERLHSSVGKTASGRGRQDRLAIVAGCASRPAEPASGAASRRSRRCSRRPVRSVLFQRPVHRERRARNR